MFRVFTSFADFDGCAEGQGLWCFDCHTADRQNRTWCVSDMPADEAEDMARRYADETYGDELEYVNFFDPCYPDFLGNFDTWYADDNNRETFLRACETEASIADDGHDRQAKRDRAMSMLREAGLEAHMGEIEDVPMWDVVRDVLGEAG